MTWFSFQVISKIRSSSSSTKSVLSDNSYISGCLGPNRQQPPTIRVEQMSILVSPFSFFSASPEEGLKIIEFNLLPR